MVPKRSLLWLDKNHNDIYQQIQLLFPDTKISDVVNYLQAGINSSKEIPGCSVCGKPVHLNDGKLLTECSISCAQKSQKVKSKINETCVKKYGKKRNFGDAKKYDLGEHYLHKHLKNLDDVNDDEIMTLLSNKSWEYTAEHFGLTLDSHSSAHRFMEKYGYPIKKVSGFSSTEKHVFAFVESLGFECRSSRKIIAPYEIDVYIPEKKLAIEFDGLYWHSSGEKSKDKEKSVYHLMKTEMCEAKGIQLLHIFENEWNDPVRQAIWKSVIRHKLGLSNRIYARKCTVKEIPVKIANKFVEYNHLQQKAIASKAYGLFYADELVQVITLAKPRYTKGYDWEIIRMCSKRDTSVTGGASKLISKIDGSVISYGNRRWCSTLSNVYDSMMEFSHISKPCYWYVNKNELHHRSSYMKYKLKDKLQVFDDKITEVENCYLNGLRRIWDCGNLIYIKQTNQ